MSDEFSNFKSAMDWRDLHSVEEKPTAEFVPFKVGLFAALEQVAASFEIAGVTESPIETLFGARVKLVLGKVLKDAFSVVSQDKLAGTQFALVPQFSLNRFRYDFALAVDGVAVVLVECDGKDFHSSPEQIENDRLKDKAAEDAGIPLLRFTGSDINNQTDWCVQRSIMSLLDEGRRRGYS